MSKSSRFNYLKSHIMSNPNTLAKKFLPEATLQVFFNLKLVIFPTKYQYTLLQTHGFGPKISKKLSVIPNGQFFRYLLNKMVRRSNFFR